MAAAPTGRDMNIVLVDDEPSITEIAQRYIETHPSIVDARIKSFQTLSSLWEYINSGAPVDVIFIDLILNKDKPPLNAKMTLQQIPELSKHGEVVVISGWENYRSDAMAAGARDFICKDGQRDGLTFWEQLAKFIRSHRPPTKAEKSLEKLREIIHSPKEHGS